MVIVASVQPESRSNFLHLIWFHSSKEGPDHTVQDWPRSGLYGLARFWPNASGSGASQCAKIIRPGSGKMQPAHYLFPTFRLDCFLPHMALITLCKVSLDQIWFWPNGSGPTLRANTSEPIQIRCESDSACLLGNGICAVQMNIVISTWTVVQSVHMYSFYFIYIYLSCARLFRNTEQRFNSLVIFRLWRGVLQEKHMSGRMSWPSATLLV